MLSVFDVVSGRGLAGRMDEIDDRTPVERAAADRSWTYGHVIVDEAQELTAMAWRALMRRIPTRSMTIVGDLFQSSSPGGASSWGDVLGPYVRAENWRVAELTVNYRAPAEVMEVAARVLADIDPGATPPRSVRTVGLLPWKERVDAEELGTRLRKAVEAELAAGTGNLAVVVAAGAEAEAWAVLDGVDGLAAVGPHGPDLRARAVVLTVNQVKGLEFDSVFVIEPAAIVEASARGRSDLYVALTRATTTLGILHTRDLPAALADDDGWAPQGHAGAAGVAVAELQVVADDVVAEAVGVGVEDAAAAAAGDLLAERGEAWVVVEGEDVEHRAAAGHRVDLGVGERERGRRRWPVEVHAAVAGQVRGRFAVGDDQHDPFAARVLVEELPGQQQGVLQVGALDVVRLQGRQVGR